ncbi:unnamed protein product [Linum tenue]|uniref:UDP-galactose/UDP-glucose transporter 3 n=1 Tax=Linum tenue TaxID=586396 RepID=A0AAV0HT28_9ROSI|nr:unnamed protein product [Linum tenue]
MEAHNAGLRRVILLAFCIAGIWAAYIYQGVVQETLSTKRFGPDGERFEHLAFLNLAQSVVCLIWSFMMIKMWSRSSGGGAPWWSYWSAGITNTIGPAMGIEALKYISYPAQACFDFSVPKKLVTVTGFGAGLLGQNMGEMISYSRMVLEMLCDSSLKATAFLHWNIEFRNEKMKWINLMVSQPLLCIYVVFMLAYINFMVIVLAKSSKMIPVMLMGSLVYGIRYTLPEYLCTFLVAGGVSTFALLKTNSKTISKLAHPNAPLGYGLCFLNLAFDGFTNATQDSLTARYPKTTAWDIMLGMNLWGTIYNIVYMFGWPYGMGYDAVQFCKQHPEAAWDILYYCLCGAVGQNFIFLTISRFGSLANTTITTTRKFVSIVVSSVLSGNPLSTKQWGSVAMVFSGLSYQIFLKWRKLQKVQKKRKNN